MKLHVCAKTHVGNKRANNEDNIAVNACYKDSMDKKEYEINKTCSEGVFAVCDGMGGEAYGELASYYGVKALALNYKNILEASDVFIQKDIVESVVQIANEQICEEAKTQGVRIGSTFAMVSIKDGIANIYNIGDSRIYLFRMGCLSQLSKDHTVTQQKIDIGAITKEESKTDSGRNKLTQHLGIFESEMIIETHAICKSICDGDVFLICSDGLTDMVDDSRIAEIMIKSPSAIKARDALVLDALENGGVDNISVIIISCDESIVKRCLEKISKISRR